MESLSLQRTLLEMIGMSVEGVVARRKTHRHGTHSDMRKPDFGGSNVALSLRKILIYIHASSSYGAGLLHRHVEYICRTVPRPAWTASNVRPSILSPFSPLPIPHDTSL